ncbi:transcription antitermination factor NusB [Acetohalobium arabaticum]|uniref:Transcription antitermination protein NusB n=1 Tax=Acetohalobium arabaticum (strain ATCC 49924 / DSM 5501 / Z-7288) TaxID=574087 RepID=D9QRV3_ACEAZ|nr:transcription antitermination factor NusB [Acetohalobium arabaticum]ADL13244.1 NusB antitermination factor [Acetohalobium arabaticum DSM 5501]
MTDRYSRHEARKIAVQTLYQIDINDEGLEKNLEMLTNRIEGLELEDTFLEEIITGTYQNLSEIDKELNESAEGWKVSRMGKVDRNILRLAIYEILYVDDIPIEVSIDEAVELAKEFIADKSPKFINGVLGRVVSKQEE